MPSNSMNVINYNRNQLPQREKFKNRLGGYISGRTTEYDFPKATTKQLKDIGKRLKEERKIRKLKVILLTSILFICLLCVLAYLADDVVDLLSI